MKRGVTAANYVARTAGLLLLPARIVLGGPADPTPQERTILALAATPYKSYLSQTNDAALARFGEDLLRAVQTRDLKLLDLKETDPENLAEVTNSACRLVQQMERFGMDFQGAELKLTGASFQCLFARAGPDKIDGVEGDKLKVSFAVRSPKKSRSGASLSGEYAFFGEEAVRRAGQWHLTGKIQWCRFPEGILDGKAAKELELENYVAEHDTLPPGLPAPDIEFVRMDNEAHMRLTNLLGKVVVLDFWAVGCAPCQEPLQKMQKYFDEHPNWKGRVELIPISVDGTVKPARNHLVRHGWTNTFNVWAGPGMFKSAPAVAFRISGIPTCYIVDPTGTIVDAGNPWLLDIPGAVDPLLR